MTENKLEKLKQKLRNTCKKTKTSYEGMKLLINYYIKDVKMTELEAYEYALGLFEKGVVDQIKFLGIKK